MTTQAEVVIEVIDIRAAQDVPPSTSSSQLNCFDGNDNEVRPRPLPASVNRQTHSRAHWPSDKGPLTTTRPRANASHRWREADQSRRTPA